jgi:alpha-L-rhamnosidase
VRLKHAEALENNEIVTKTLRFAKATDTITLSGKPIVWEPRFTFHGFRYVQVENMPTGKDGINLKDFTAVVIYTDMERTGWFECSDPMLNRLHDNVLWSMRGNFVGVPTDCPQRVSIISRSCFLLCTLIVAIPSYW